MTTVSIAAFKANLSRYLRHIRRGGEVQILDRGVPVARLMAPKPGSDDAVRDRLVGDGMFRPRAGPARSILDSHPWSCRRVFRRSSPRTGPIGCEVSDWLTRRCSSIVTYATTALLVRVRS